MKKIASNELKEFLQDWLNWAEGRQSKVYYNAGCGLCSSLFRYGGNVKYEELDSLFNYKPDPFGVSNYFIRQRLLTQHQDPNRLAWVKAALNDTLDTWELI